MLLQTITVKCQRALWHICLVLGNDPGTITFTPAVTKRWLSKQRAMLGNGLTTKQNAVLHVVRVIVTCLGV
jgi:hypothetical protein